MSVDRFGEQVVDLHAERLRVLLVEDDVALAHSLRLALAEDDIDVHVAANAAEALEAVSHDERLDSVLLDLGLPDEDGIEVCRRIRGRSDVLIVMVTARSDSTDVVAGLQAGADDYVRKPVAGFELAARVRALVRRSGAGAEQEWVECGALQVSTRHGTVRRDGRELAMTRTERRLLRELALQCGEPVTREHLLTSVWGYDYFGDTRLLDVHVHRLRVKLEQDGSHPQHLITVRGLGYQLVP